MSNEPNELVNTYVTVWSKVVDTQMHFNEMSVKSRQLGLTFVAAALGVGVVLLSRGSDFAIPIEIYSLKFEIHAAVFLVLAAALASWVVRILDLNVYHKMLRGAVTFGEDFEENYMKKIFQLDKGMTQAISHFSRYTDASVRKDQNRYVYDGSKFNNAEQKIRTFYTWTLVVLIVTAILLFVLTGHFSLADGNKAQ